MKRAPEYDCWAKIIQRCENPRSRNYQYWGGRGITICERWRHSFANFLTDVGPRPTPLHSIDRIDNDGHYEPGNVHWVQRLAQNMNRRNTQWITWKGRRMTLREWSLVLGFSYVTIQMRLLRGWTIDRAFTEPLGIGRRLTQLGTKKPRHVSH